MPQMSPMSWMLIFLILVFYLTMTFNSFTKFNTMTIKSSKIKKTENTMKW